MTKNSKTNAFTLIELLLVIAVIVILAALLFPSLASARTLAKASVCGSNMRTLYMAAASYAGDFNMYAPPAGDVYTQDHEIGIDDWYAQYSSFGRRDRKFWMKYADNLCAGFPDELHAGSEYYGTVGGNPGNTYGYWIRLPYIVFFSRNRPPRGNQTYPENAYWERKWHGWQTYSFEEARGQDCLANPTPDMRILGKLSVAATSGDGTVIKNIRTRPPANAPAFGDLASYNGMIGYHGLPMPHKKYGCNVVFMDGHRTFTPFGAFAKAITDKNYIGGKRAEGAAKGVKATYWRE